MRLQVMLLTSVFLAACAQAQWTSFRVPGTPRTRDGKPNLSAPPPHANGKPDLSGIWQAESAAPGEIQQFLLPGGINGLGEDLPNKYFFNVFADFGMGKEPFQPGAAEAAKRNAQRPSTLCTVPTLPLGEVIPAPFKIVQTPRNTVILYESDTNFFRQIFTDGRKLPDDPQPSWLGYSVGHWDRDSFVVETTGFNDKGPLDAMGHPHSESLRLKEVLRRRDFGHLESQITVDDAKTYTQPVTIRVNFRLLPDTEILESFCAEAETDLAHMPKP